MCSVMILLLGGLETRVGLCTLTVSLPIQCCGEPAWRQGYNMDLLHSEVSILSTCGKPALSPSGKQCLGEPGDEARYDKDIPLDPAITRVF